MRGRTPARDLGERLDRALKVRPEEASVAHRMFGVMLLAWAGFAVGASAVESLFFSRFGSTFLPWMYLALGLVTFPATVAFGLIQGRFDRRRVAVLALPAMAAIVGGLRILLLLSARWTYPVLWLSMMVLWIVQAIALWSLAGIVHDARSAKRLFPLYGAGVILGGALGGLATRPLAAWLHAENLLLVWTGSLAAAAALASRVAGTRRMHRHRWLKGRRVRGPRPVQQMQEGLRAVVSSRLLRRMAGAAVIVGILGFSLSFPFAVSVTARFPQPDRLAGFLGLFYGLANAVALILTLGAANRLFARIGVPSVVAVLPVLYAAGFGLLALTATFAVLTALRAIQLVWIYGVWAAAWQSLYNVVPPERREQARTFIEGGPVPAGIALAGVILLIVQRVASLRALFIVASGIAVAGVAVALGIRRAYRRAVVEALREGWPEVFGPTEEGAEGFEWDSEAWAGLGAALGDPDPDVRRVAMEIAADLPVAPARNLCLTGLADPDPVIRAAALRGVRGSPDRDALPQVLGMLGDPEPHVLALAVDAVAAMAPADPGVMSRLARLLRHEDPTVRSRAAVGLLRSNGESEAEEVLFRMAGAEDPAERTGAIAAMAEAARGGERIVEGLSDRDPAVRKAAALALGNLGEGVEALLGALGDVDEGVREAAAGSLATMGEFAVRGLVAALQDEPGDRAALLALLGMPGADLGPVRAYGLQQVDRALHYHRLWMAVAGIEGPAFGLLAHALRRRALDHASRATLALAPREDHGEFRLALEGIASRDPNQRASAVETLDTAGTREVRPLLTIWDPDIGSGVDGEDALLSLMRDDDAWLRACAALAAGAVRTDALEEGLRRAAEGDPDPLVRGTAARSLEGGDGMPSTLSLMDRVLALRQVPLFRELSPADLKRVAEAAVESEFGDGTAIAEHGSPGDAMHVVVTGEVRVLVEAEGRIVEVARRGPGYIVGEMAVLSEEPRMASLIAAGAVRTLSLDRKRFQRILRERPDAGLAVMRELCARLTEAHGRGAVDVQL